MLLPVSLIIASTPVNREDGDKMANERRKEGEGVGRAVREEGVRLTLLISSDRPCRTFLSLLKAAALGS